MFSRFRSKWGCAGIVIRSTVLKINPIGIHQTMENQHGYENAKSDFDILKNFEVGKKIMCNSQAKAVNVKT